MRDNLLASFLYCLTLFDRIAIIAKYNPKPREHLKGEGSLSNFSVVANVSDMFIYVNDCNNGDITKLLVAVAEVGLTMT